MVSAALPNSPGSFAVVTLTSAALCANFIATGADCAASTEALPVKKSAATNFDAELWSEGTLKTTAVPLFSTEAGEQARNEPPSSPQYLYFVLSLLSCTSAPSAPTVKSTPLMSGASPSDQTETASPSLNLVIPVPKSVTVFVTCSSAESLTSSPLPETISLLHPQATITMDRMNAEFVFMFIFMLFPPCVFARLFYLHQTSISPRMTGPMVVAEHFFAAW